MTGLRALLISHEEVGRPGQIGRVLADRGVDVQRHVVLNDDGTSNLEFPDIKDFDFVISFGSFHSVTDPSTAEWVDAEVDLIHETFDTETPYLGVCFGGQILTKAVGGSIERSPVTEVGAIHINPTQGELPIPTGPWFSWHEDRMVLPADIEVLADTDISVQMFRSGKAVGLQFHPEVDEEILSLWLELGGKDHLPDTTTPDDFMREWKDAQEKAHANATELVDWFIAEVVTKK